MLHRGFFFVRLFALPSTEQSLIFQVLGVVLLWYSTAEAAGKMP